MYLVDTNVLSAAAPGSRERSPPLIERMETNSDRLFLSAVTVAEICGGIAKMRRTGSHARATSLEDWLELVLHLYADRVLPFDMAAARIAGALTDHMRAAGLAPGFADIAIAATAANRDLTVLTRNLRRFEPMAVAALDPFRSLTPPHTAP